MLHPLVLGARVGKTGVVMPRILPATFKVESDGDAQERSMDTGAGERWRGERSPGETNRPEAAAPAGVMTKMVSRRAKRLRVPGPLIEAAPLARVRAGACRRARGRRRRALGGLCGLSRALRCRRPPAGGRQRPAPCVRDLRGGRQAFRGRACPGQARALKANAAAGAHLNKLGGSGPAPRSREAPGQGAALGPRPAASRPRMDRDNPLRLRTQPQARSHAASALKCQR